MTNKTTRNRISYAPFLVGAYLTLLITGLIYLSNNFKSRSARSIALFVAAAMVMPAVTAFQMQLVSDQDEQPGSVLDNYSSKLIDEYMVELLKPAPSKFSTNKFVYSGKNRAKKPTEKDSKNEYQEIEFIDAVFEDAVDWNAFSEFLSELKDEINISSKISIKSVKKQNGKFTIVIDAPQNTDKAAIENFLNQQHKSALSNLEEKNLEYAKALAYKEGMSFLHRSFVEQISNQQHDQINTTDTKRQVRFYGDKQKTIESDE
ncbi:hypothetical protein Pse7367_3180 [Thalassoporum mexicanum PCC 7367]|uniref:hypothetical protein n=1 Tax=Thalassoporum mexicanum TaxID=3457544 RepID=UPI00029FEACC|nr:hypothetical protein [Pseudanabaena sp. PCC 7367]AFY71428.1 hypothetical protein Pse7367_3180 [Pseudanabaena sp. PCC 7367]